MSSGDAAVLARPFESEIGGPRQLSSAPLGFLSSLLASEGLARLGGLGPVTESEPRLDAVEGFCSWLLVGSVS